MARLRGPAPATSISLPLPQLSYEPS